MCTSNSAREMTLNQNDFAIPQSTTQTTTICAQKLVPISTCLSNVLNEDAKTVTAIIFSLCKSQCVC